MNDNEYPILSEDGKQFCRCRRDGKTILLIAKNCSLSLLQLEEQAMNPEIYRKSRGKKYKKGS